MHGAEHHSRIIRVQIQVQGIVQGVGFRPYIYSLAKQSALRGQVFNNTSGVLIDVEGEVNVIKQFINEITSNPPPLSQIQSVQSNNNLASANYHDFRIVESAPLGVKLVPISADVATCPDCQRELFDSRDRRHRYPFINCTNCGPRFTIIEGIPYDRAQTTMRDFVMCAACRAEYENPLDRRFHAEPIACWQCGPQLKLNDACGHEVELKDGEDIISLVRSLLTSGMIVVIKGIGGFHLACDALDVEAVERLRQRKYREDKPFALMARSVDVIREYARVTEAENALLNSARRPVVLLEKKIDAHIPKAVAARLNTLGFMLPYTPLHHLILETLDHPLVMTSGNVSHEPICYEDEDAVRRLNKIADYFLFHDRCIHIRTDDSVAQVHQGREIVLRRSRGYAPAPIKVGFKFKRGILACGAELKNTFCLTRGSDAFVSHHIGDLENLETLQSFKQGIEHYKLLFHLRPEVVAYDLHPEYLSTKYALELDENYTKIGVQHHHAHIASCMSDNRIEGEVIGVAMDGLGFGTDAQMWGGEFFVADFLEAERIAHLEYIPMPGGTRAIHEPWRMTASYLYLTFGNEFLNLNLPFVQNMDRKAWTTLRRMIETGTNSPETSSMGRLFDAVSCLLGLRKTVNYEGQAAIELEAIVNPRCLQRYEFAINAVEQTISAKEVIQRVVEDLIDGVSPSEVSAKFHLGVAALIATIAGRVRDERGLNRVVLSGGVFQNRFLLDHVCRILNDDNFNVFTHSRVPTNDGGISLGQAAVASAHLAAGRI